MEILFALVKLPFVLIAGILGIVVFAFVIFSILVLLDCLKRPISEFGDTIFKDPQYDKVAWIVIIILTAKLFGAGAFAYLLMVRGRKEGT